MTRTYSRLASLIIFTLLSLIGLGCIERKPEVLTKKESPVTAELVSMVREHEQMRASGKYSTAVISEADLRHRQTVYQLMAQSLIVEPEDLYRAAMLLQSSDSAVCAENAMLAYYCALESARRGFEDARRLAAESFDKYLIGSGLKQKYGTQLTRDPAGRYTLYPYDPGTTDQERAAWNVPSLDSLKLLADKLSSEKATDR